LTPDHLGEEDLLRLRGSYDSTADEALARLQALQTDARAESKAKGPVDGPIPPECPMSESSTDLFTLLKTHQAQDAILGKLWNQVSTVPDWVDWDQLARGQNLLYRYGFAALTGLAFESLLGGLGAGRVVETLTRTGGFATKVVRKRLLETTMHVLLVTRSLEDIKPGGEAWVTTIRVRLLHSAVRQRILKVEKEKPGYYNVEKYGIPANDLDSIATIATFSSTLLFQALPRQGLFPTQQEIKDYLALWRYIAYLMGTPHEQFAEPDLARRMMESLILHEINPTSVSCILANNILSGFANQPPTYASRSMLAATARWLNGHDLCDALGLPKPPLYYYLLMVGQCLFFMGTCYLARYFKPWDNYKQRNLRKMFWYIVVDSPNGLKGTKTKFEIKYIPRAGKVTEMDYGEENVDEGKVLKKHKGIEARNLKTLAVSATVLILISWSCWTLLKTAVNVVYS
jgi:hypothetical protein